MFEIKKLDNIFKCSTDEDRGSKDKFWVKLDGIRYLFKFSSTTNRKYCHERPCLSHCNELIAYELSQYFSITHSEISLAEYDNKIGLLSKINHNSEDEFLMEFLYLIDEPHYMMNHCVFLDMDLLFYIIKNEKINHESEIVKMMLFDILIGETDRHVNNFGYIKKVKNIERFAPLYDSGNSLIHTIFEMKPNRRNNFLNKPEIIFDKMKSRFDKDKTNKKERYSHLEVLNYIKNRYNEEYNNFIKEIYEFDFKMYEDIIDRMPSKALSFCKNPDIDLVKEIKKMYIEYFRIRINKILDFDKQ